jgi:hypothetical protein
MLRHRKLLCLQASFRRRKYLNPAHSLDGKTLYMGARFHLMTEVSPFVCLHYLFNHITVPIYDGRIQDGDKGGFMSMEDDWKQVKELPPYKREGKECEVPSDALVIVGYTASTYVGSNGSTYFASNVQFVIVLSDSL